MGNSSNNLIQNLLEIAEIDRRLLGILAERKHLDEELKRQKNALEELGRKITTINTALNNLRALYQTEEKRIRDERAKLKDRRAALETFTNYKLQEAALKEIQNTEAEIDAQEEEAIEHVEKAGEVEKLLKDTESASEKAKDDLSAFTTEMQGTLENLAERETRLKSDREGIAANVDPASLTLYGNTAKKHTSDPIVSTKDGKCSSCFMAQPPGLLSELAAGEKLVACRGCKRILFLEEN